VREADEVDVLLAKMAGAKGKLASLERMLAEAPPDGAQS